MAPTISDTLQRYGRGIAGGLVVSVPLLYTMEMWWTGFLSHPERLLATTLGSLALLAAYQTHAGMRENTSWRGVVLDSFEVLGLALLLSAALLTLLAQVDWSRPLAENVGLIVVEASPVAIGMSVGGSQFGEPVEECSRHWSRHQVTAACGAFLLASTVGPTQEIQLLARVMSWLQLVVLALLSLVLTLAILFLAEWLRPEPGPHLPGVLPVTLATYAIALATAWAILWVFGRLDATTPAFALRQLIVLGFPAALGAAAGERLLR